MKIILAILMLAAFGGATHAQSNAAPPKCTLTLAQSPAIRGFKLGMTIEQIKARLPNVEIRKLNEFGYAQSDDIEAASVPEAERENFENIKSVVLSFLDGRVVGVLIYYADSAKWQNAKQLVPLVSAKYGLSGEWLGGDATSNDLSCNGFVVSVSASGTSAGLSIYDSSLRETLRQRQAAKEDAARRAFKP